MGIHKELYHQISEHPGDLLDWEAGVANLIALCLGQAGIQIHREISISGTLLKVDELANTLQVCQDSGTKKVLLPITSAADIGTVPADLIGSFNLIFYNSAEDAVFKVLGVE